MLMKAGVHVVRRDAANKALVRFHPALVITFLIIVIDQVFLMDQLIKES
jgi:hypothetical protein